jgi:3-oxoacyl-[acyl-carrier protein] reductase
MSLGPSSILLTDRVTVVTGAGQGVGRATALLFARFGARLVLCDRVADTLAATVEDVRALGRPVLDEHLDVRDFDAVDELVSAIKREFGRVDVLVNNAGGTFFARVLELSPKGDQTLVDENFLQVTNLVRRTVDLMPPGTAIVNLTSIEAHQAAPGFGVYAAMKAAVASLTRTLALELGSRGIRVNAVAPDAVPTEGDAGLAQVATDRSNEYLPSVTPPLGHLGTPEDVAAAVLFLASDLSRFVTGTTIHVDGGNWAAGGWRRTTP